MRLNEKELRTILKNKSLAVRGQFGGALTPKLLPSSENEPNIVERSVASLNTCRIETRHIDGEMFEATFHGASLLSLNTLLRLDHRTGDLKRYRAACHNAAERAVLLAVCKSRPNRRTLPKNLAVSLFRSGVKPFDNDALVAAYKFLIDGFRCAGLIEDDNPTCISSFDRLVQTCGASVPPLTGINFHLGNPVTQ